MEVIGAGWGRTGTLTLKTALDMLGLPCYHMKDLIYNGRGDAKEWLRAAEGEPVDFAQLLSGYKACADWPTTSFYKELMELYPQAKVILTVRDPNTWYTSAEATIWQVKKVLLDSPWYVRVIAGLLPPGADMGRMVQRLIWERDLQDSFEDPQRAQQLFVEWNEDVKKHVPPERLLVFEPRQGWQPLCAFLDLPVPDEPFPHVNDTESFNKMVAFARRRAAVLTYAVPAAAVAVLAAGAVLVARCVSRRR